VERRTGHDRREYRRGGRRVNDWMTPQEVGNLTGFSAGFIRSEIRASQLRAQWVQSQRSQAGRWRIHRDDAKAYAIRLGVWRDPATPVVSS
jgi:hypothetical protein